MTTHGEERKRKPYQDERYQLRWQKPRKDKHEENNLHHTRVHQDATRNKIRTQDKSFHGATKEIT